MSDPSLNILVVDDDDVAVESITRSLKKGTLKHAITFAENGQVALEILRRAHPDRTIQRPYVILLDLNMPLMNGFEFLRQLRADDQLRESIVFVLTTSSSDTDRMRAYQEYIAGYMVKSAVGPQFSKFSQLLFDYQSAVELP